MSLDAINWVAKQKAGNATAKHVLLWLAFHSNGKSGKCFPSLDTLAEEMEVGSKNTIRAALKTLLDRKLISCEREMKGARVARTFYRLNFDGSNSDTSNIEGSKIDISNIEGSKIDISNIEHDGSNSEPYGSNIELSMVQKLNPNKEIEQGINRERNRESSMRTSGNSSAIAAVASAQAQTPYPDDFDQSLFDEAQLVASGNLESFENEVNAEVVFSPDAQIPIENIEILNATASDSIFGTDTPPKDQNAAERKSEAISKPKRKRVSSSVVKDKPEDISQEVWDDWLTTRRAKRLPLTQTALNSVRREAASAGLTFQAAVTFAVEQGWAAFRAEWYRNATRKGDSTKTNARYLTAQERYEERMRKAGEMSDEEYFAQFDLPEEILNYEKAQEAKRHVAS